MKDRKKETEISNKDRSKQQLIFAKKKERKKKKRRNLSSKKKIQMIERENEGKIGGIRIEKIKSENLRKNQKKMLGLKEQKGQYMKSDSVTCI